MLPQTERLVLRLKVPRYLRPIICCLALLSQIPASPVGKPHGNTFVITKTNICRIRPMHAAWISHLAKTDFCHRAQKGFIKCQDLLYFCFADNLDFLTVWHCHLSVLGLLRNNCQFITQVGVAERAALSLFADKFKFSPPDNLI